MSLQCSVRAHARVQLCMRIFANRRSDLFTYYSIAPASELTQLFTMFDTCSGLTVLAELTDAIVWYSIDVV